MGERKGEPAGGLSGETHCAPASLRSDSRRKFEFLCRSTPVLQLACGVAQALRLELPLPLAGEGGGEGAYISFPHWGKAGMGASLLLVEAVCLLSGRGSGLGPTADPISFASPKEMGERKGEPCRRLVRLNSRRSCVALVKQAAGNQIFMSKHASLTAGVRGGTSAVPSTPSPACGRGLG